MADIRTNGNAADLKEFLPVHSEGKQWLHFWNTPEAFAAHVETIKPGWHDGAWTNPASFGGTKSLPEAVQLCREGWPEGAERAEKLRDRINAANPMGPRMVRYDVAGAYPSVPRALAGNPLNMRRVDSARLRRRPVLTLVSDACVGANIPKRCLENRAAVVAAVVDAVEAAGFSCQIITVTNTSRSGVLASVAVQIKESTVPADIGRLAYSLGHPAYFRRLCFAAWSETRFTEPLTSSLGTVKSVEQSPAMRESGVYVLPSTHDAASAFGTEEAAATRGLAFIIDALRKQGCPAFPQESSDAA